ncbi:aldo/keto reductase [Pedobacter sp. HMF7647]|uniref:Aldo/keto reductase n=1 Tax=Hufsiella arboris TaxID=2695275 RepID=A0A7K1YB10_9SPHI|nr:aldo/keto reductase [Hufsiella arboris]MXV51772.1 aldo/keto reductase [Hufsiella arboris]
MKLNKLGKSSLHVSEISFGCMSLKPGQADAKILLNKAADQGINLFDTADLYDKGENEKLVGQALQSRRKKVLIATKVGNQWRPDGSGWDWNPTREYILKAADESLNRLRTDYIDLYQLHGGTLDDPIDETIEAFELLKQQGKIREYGISSIRPNVIREYVSRSNIVSVMMQYSLLDRRPEESCFELLQENQISVLSRGALAQGLLVNKPSKAYLDLTSEIVANAAAAIKTVNNQSPANVALRFILNHPVVASAVCGMHTFQQLDDAVSASFYHLTGDQFKYLNSAVKQTYYEQHR